MTNQKYLSDFMDVRARKILVFEKKNIRRGLLSMNQTNKMLVHQYCHIKQRILSLPKLAQLFMS